MDLIRARRRVSFISFLSSDIREGEFSGEDCDCVSKSTVLETMDPITSSFKGKNSVDPHHNDFGK